MPKPETTYCENCGEEGHDSCTGGPTVDWAKLGREAFEQGLKNHWRKFDDKVLNYLFDKQPNL